MEKARVVKMDMDSTAQAFDRDLERDDADPAYDRALESYERRQQPDSVASEVAGNNEYMKNWRIPGMKSEFPISPSHWQVSKFYPLALNGPLYVDEVEDGDEHLLEAKKRVMRRLGFRYVIVTPKRTKHEVNYELDDVYPRAPHITQ